jgi:hypothetical protein
MVKNSSGGKKGKKVARKEIGASAEKKELPVADGETNIYGQVTSLKGGNVFEVLTIDGVQRRGFIRGKFRTGLTKKNNTLTPFSWVLVDKRDFLSKSNLDCDLEYKYSDVEKSQLKQTFPSLPWHILEENERKNATNFSASSSSSSSSHLPDIEFSHDAVGHEVSRSASASSAKRALALQAVQEEEDDCPDVAINVDDI